MSVVTYSLYFASAALGAVTARAIYVCATTEKTYYECTRCGGDPTQAYHEGWNGRFVDENLACSGGPVRVLKK